ncbi:MAG: DUF1211 domain-containing protein [Bdellovibrionales bacterium]|nr:DUF1211 domain-containing protein [Bdellovibrionales bacterium]
MHKGRIEAFSDGVFAIIITIMVLELKPPHDDSIEALIALIPVFLSYVLSFIYVGIYWNNHHHMFQAVKSVKGSVLWANLHLLFWLSLMPFVTAWAGENHFTCRPVAFYGFDLLMCGVAYWILAKVLIKHHGHDSVLAKALGDDIKGLISPLVYIIGIAIACYAPMVSCMAYVAVAVMWLIPDTRIERVMKD